MKTKTKVSTAKMVFVIQRVLKRVRIQVIVPVLTMAAGLAFFGIGAFVAVKSVVRPMPPLIILNRGSYVPAQVVFKVKAGKDPTTAINKALVKKQILYRNIKTGLTVPGYDVAVKKAPKDFQKQELQPTLKNLRQLFPKMNISDEVRQDILLRSGAQDPDIVYKKLGLDRWYVAEVNQAQTDIPTLIQQLQGDEGIVEKAEANGISHVTSTEIINEPEPTPAQTTGVGDTTDATNPNDPRYRHFGAIRSGLRDQWGLDALNVSKAWSISTGSPNVVIAVIDTGVDYNHSDLVGKSVGEGNMWVNPGEDINHNGCADYWPDNIYHYLDDIPAPCRPTDGSTQMTGDLNGMSGNGGDDDGYVYVDDLNGVDFTTAPAYDWDGPMETVGFAHGTAIAGIAAAVTNNANHMAGICQYCKIMPLRTSAAEETSYTKIVAAIQYAVAKGTKVINLSVTVPINYSSFQDAVTMAISAGVVVVSGADDHAITGNADYPAAYDGVIAVGATDTYGSRWVDTTTNPHSGSNSGNWLDIMAPGEEIISLDSGREDVDSRAGGTSYSVAYVSGVVGLMRSLNSTLGVDDITTIIENTAKHMHDVKDNNGNLVHFDDDFNIYAGYGLIDAAAALQETKVNLPGISIQPNSAKLIKSGSSMLFKATAYNTSIYHARVPIQFSVPGTVQNWEEIYSGTADVPGTGGFLNITVDRDIPVGTQVRFKIDPNNIIPKAYPPTPEDLMVVATVVDPAAPFLDVPATKEVSVNQSANFAVSAAYLSGATITNANYYSAQRLPTAQATFSNKNFVWTPGTLDAGTYQVDFTVQDQSNNNQTDSRSTTILAKDPNGPMLNRIGDRDVKPGETIALTLQGIKPAWATSSVLSYSVDGLPATTLNQNSGAFSWTPTDADVGEHDVTFRTYLPYTNYQYQEKTRLTVHGNRSPVWNTTLVSPQTVDEDNTLFLQLNAADPDSDLVSFNYQILHTPPGKTVSQAVINPQGQFTWHPTFGSAPSDPAEYYRFHFIASDGKSSITQDADVHVNHVAQPAFVTIINNEGFASSTRNGRIVMDGGAPDVCKGMGEAVDACNITETHNLRSRQIPLSDLDYIRVRFNAHGKWNALPLKQRLKVDDNSYVTRVSYDEYVFDIYPQPGTEPTWYYHQRTLLPDDWGYQRNIGWTGPQPYAATLRFVEQDDDGQNIPDYGWAVVGGPVPGPYGWPRTWAEWVTEAYMGAHGDYDKNGFGVRVWSSGTTPDSILTSITMAVIDDSNGDIAPNWTAEIHRKSFEMLPTVTPSVDHLEVPRRGPVSFTITANDPNGDYLKLWKDDNNNPYGMSMTVTNVQLGRVTARVDWTPSYGQAGDFTLSFFASDAINGYQSDPYGHGFGPTLDVPVRVANQPPILYPIPDQLTIAFADPKIVPVSYSDPDGDPVTLFALGCPGITVSKNIVTLYGKTNQDYICTMFATDGATSAMQTFRVGISGGGSDGGGMRTPGGIIPKMLLD